MAKVRSWRIRRKTTGGDRPFCDKLPGMEHPIHRVTSFRQTAPYTLRIEFE
jgi:hypothetical protein